MRESSRRNGREREVGKIERERRVEETKQRKDKEKVREEELNGENETEKG